MKNVFKSILILPIVLFLSQFAKSDFKLSDHQLKIPEISFVTEKYQLKNGLTVILVPDRSIPMISYHTWFKVGSRNEWPGVTGAAHMLEHMMFKGAKKYSGKEFDQLLHSNGITNNAFTSFDYTGFYQNLPSSKLEIMMDMEADRLRNLKLDPADLKSELQVVGEERRWRVDNNPNGLLQEQLLDTMFKTHPYRWPVIGWMKDIQAYTSESLRQFYDQFYVPNNAVLVLVGDFDTSKTKKLIEKYYGNLPSRDIPKKEIAPEAERTNSQRKSITGEVQSTSFIVGFPGIRETDADSATLQVLSTLVAGGSFSRLHKRLVQEEKISTFVGSYNMSGVDPGIFQFWVFMKPGAFTSKAEVIINEEIKKLKSDLVSAEELQRAKNQILKSYLDALKTIDGKAENLAEYEILYGDQMKVFEYPKRILAIKESDIKAAANKYFQENKKVTVILNPKK